MNNVFDNVRWPELGLAIGTTGAGTFSGLSASTMSTPMKTVLTFASMCFVAWAYLRNPKKLDWVKPADAAPTEEPKL